MHDPMHVVADLRRPWPHRSRPLPAPDPNPRRRDHGLGPIRVRPAEFRCAHCDRGRVKDPPPSYHENAGHYAGEPCPDCAGRGYNRVPRRRRLWLSWAFWRFGRREWYFPGLITLWHVDPETDGSDSSCRNRYRPAWRMAKADGDGLREWFWWKVMAYYGWWHVRHWKLQIRPWQDFNRWAWSRCNTCGGRFRWGEAPVSDSWHGEGPRWRRPEPHVHHMRCRESVGVREVVRSGSAASEEAGT